MWAHTCNCGTGMTEGRLQEQVNLAKHVSSDKIMDVNLASRGGCKPNQRKKRDGNNHSNLKPIVGIKKGILNDKNEHINTSLLT